MPKKFLERGDNQIAFWVKSRTYKELVWISKQRVGHKSIAPTIRELIHEEADRIRNRNDAAARARRRA